MPIVMSVEAVVERDNHVLTWSSIQGKRINLKGYAILYNP